jgi:hypothetical protein
MQVLYQLFFCRKAWTHTQVGESSKEIRSKKGFSAYNQTNRPQFYAKQLYSIINDLAHAYFNNTNALFA